MRDGRSGCSRKEFDKDVYPAKIYMDHGCSDFEDRVGLGDEAGYGYDVDGREWQDKRGMDSSECSPP